jgi:predicted CoA-binding protein
MATARASLAAIEDFLAQKRIAIAGISHEPADISVALFDEFSRRGYDVVPVNPNLPEVKGRPCFARVQDIQPPVDAALVITSPAVSETVVSDCTEAGVRRIWLYRGVTQGSVSDKTLALCHRHGLQVIPGECPFMFLPGTPGFHRFHGFLRKITRRYPRRAA